MQKQSTDAAEQGQHSNAINAATNNRRQIQIQTSLFQSSWTDE